VGLLFCAVLLAGCGAEEPSEVEVPPIRPRPKAKTITPEALFAKAGDEAYTYDPSGRRDPFKPLIAPKKSVAVPVESKVECPPLQEFELASLKVVGIVWGELGRKAMLKAPNGRGYAVTSDMLIGRNCSRVLRIDANRIIIEETRQDAEGNVSKEEVVLRLREREG
jgi:type IV pilus assembly protein PilP